MVADGTEFRCRGDDYRMTAVAELPHDYTALLEHFHDFDIFKKRTVSFLMHLFDSRNAMKLSGKVGKAFFSLSGILSYITVHSAFSTLPHEADYPQCRPVRQAL